MNVDEAIAVYGAGGMGREVRWLAEDCGLRVTCFVDDAAKPGQTMNDLPVLSPPDARAEFPNVAVALAIGSPREREGAAHRVRKMGYRLATLVHPSVLRSQRVVVGDGSVICAGTTLTTDVSVGESVQINLHCTVSHDAVLEDYSTLGPGVHMSGWVHVGKRVYVGTGAVIINGTAEAPVMIGDDAVVGAGACVTKSVPPRVTVVGVPARPLER